MNRSKIQITWILLLVGCFIFPNNSFSQSEKKASKQIVIVKKTMDKDGNEVVETIVKEGKEAEDFDVVKYLEENESDAANVNVEIRVKKEKRDVHAKEITTENEKQIIIIKSEKDDDSKNVIFQEDFDMETDGDKKTKIRIMKNQKGNGAFFGVMIDPSAEGMELLDVVKGSPAEKSGLKKGDILQSVNQYKISTYEELTKVLSNYKPGDSIVVMYTRDGQGNKIQAFLASSKDIPMQEMHFEKN